MKLACVAVAGVALALPAGAAARDVPLHWTERASTYGHLSVTFTVERLRIDRRGWSATLGIRNWDIELSVRPEFALLASTRAAGEAPLVLRATRATPPLPRVLTVRGTWTGAIGGPGEPPRGTYLRLRLGTFRAVIAPNLVLRHVTRHAYHLT